MTTPDDKPGAADRLSRWIGDHALLVGGVATVALIATVGLAIALATGGDETAPDTPTTEETPSSTSTPRPSITLDADREVTTIDDTGDVAAGRNQNANLVAVKVDNAERARPQIGLNTAHYVIEAPVEGGMTRFLAFFETGSDNLVGPVRSLRPVDIELVGLFADTVITTGGRPFIMGELAGNGITAVGHDPETSPLQVLQRPEPHNLFVATADVTAGAIESGMPEEDPPTGGEDVEALEIPYDTPIEWAYTDGSYVRVENDEPVAVFPTYEGEVEPMTTDVVVVMEVAERSAGYQDVNGAEVPDFDVVGSGRLWVHREGRMVEGTWARGALAAGYRFETADGEPFGLGDGRIFIHLLPAGAD